MVHKISQFNKSYISLFTSECQRSNCLCTGANCANDLNVQPPFKMEDRRLPISPLVHVCISNYYQHDGQILLSAQLMTEKEIDEAVDHLREELETFRNKAKQELKKILLRQLGK